MQLFKEAGRVLDRLDENNLGALHLTGFASANAEGDNLIDRRIRRSLCSASRHLNPDGGPFLCLSDFVRPLSSGRAGHR